MDPAPIPLPPTPQAPVRRGFFYGLVPPSRSAADVGVTRRPASSSTAIRSANGSGAIGSADGAAAIGPANGSAAIGPSVTLGSVGTAAIDGTRGHHRSRGDDGGRGNDYGGRGNNNGGCHGGGNNRTFRDTVAIGAPHEADPAQLTG